MTLYKLAADCDVVLDIHSKLPLTLYHFLNLSTSLTLSQLTRLHIFRVEKRVMYIRFLECQDDTLQCHLWAQHGHCKGIAYAEFMKRHCKATCGYCGTFLIQK